VGTNGRVGMGVRGREGMDGSEGEGRNGRVRYSRVILMFKDYEGSDAMTAVSVGS